MDNANNANEWLTIKEVSNITGKTPASIRMLIKRGKIVRIREEHHYGRKYWVIHKDECELLGTQENEDVRIPNSMRTVTEHEITIPFETYDKQRSQWENEKTELIRTYEQGLMMYRFKFEELDRKLKLLPAPVEVIAHEFEKVKSELEDKEGELHQVNQALQKLELERRELENTLQAQQEAHDGVVSEREALSHQIDQARELQGVIEGQKAKLEEELESMRRETQETAEKLSHQVEELGAGKQEAEEKAAQLDKERKILEDRLRAKEEDRQRLQAELEEEKTRAWWKKLLNLK